MNVGNLARIVGGCLLSASMAGVAVGTPLCTRALCLAEDAAWRRGNVEREIAEDAYVLEYTGEPDASVQVLLLRASPPVRGDAEAYYDRLTRYWHAHYGKAVRVYWQEAAGTRWRALRRPAQEAGMGLFQLVTVHDGHAYSLLVFVPGTVTSLPAPVLALLGSARFGGEPPAAGGVAGVRWLRSEVRWPRVAPDELEKRATLEVNRLGDGALTGFGLRHGEAGVEWFMDGFVWHGAGANAKRVPWEVRGSLRVEAPAEWQDDADWGLSLDLPAGQEPVSVHLASRLLCGRREALAEALRQLERGGGEVVQGVRTDCAAPAPAPLPAALRGEAGSAVRATLRVPAPALPRRAAEGETAMALVEARLEATPGRRQPGEALIGGVRLYFVYAPAAAGR